VTERRTQDRRITHREATPRQADAARIRDALRFYVERVAWSSADREPGGEREQYVRLLENADASARGSS